MARSREEIKKSLMSGTASNNAPRSREEIKRSLVTGTTTYNNKRDSLRKDVEKANQSASMLGQYSSSAELEKYRNDIRNAQGSVNNFQRMYGNVLDSNENKYMQDMSNYYGSWLNGGIDNLDKLYSNYNNAEQFNADVAKTKWANANKGLTYDEVKKRKATATEDELAYLNQYGTLVGYESLADYEAELADLDANKQPSSFAVSWYNKAVPIAKKLGYNPTEYDLDAIREQEKYSKDLEQKKNQIELDSRSERYLDDVSQNDDFAEMSQYDSSLGDIHSSGIGGNHWWERQANPVDKAFAGIFEGINKRFIDNGMYDFSTLDDSYARINENNFRNLSPNSPLLYSHAEQMTDEEKSVFNYLYRTDKEKAIKYLQDMGQVWQKRYVDEREQAVEQMSNEGGFWNNELITSTRIAAQPLANATSAINVVGGIIGGEYNPYNDSAYFKNFTDKAEKTVGDALNEALGNPEWADKIGVELPSFLYSTGLSSADSFIGGKIFGPGYSVVMGTGAFQTIARQMADEGASTKDIWVMASIAGLAEVVTEYVSLDKFEKLIKNGNVDGFKKFMFAALRQAGYEGSEEVASDLINFAADEMYNGGASDMQRKIAEYVAQGMTEEEAQKKAAAEFGIQVAQSFAGGALSGGGMAMVEGGIQWQRNSQGGAALRENNNLEYIDETAQNISKDSDAYKDYQRIAKNGKISEAKNAKINTAYSSIMQQAAKEDAQSILEARGFDREEAVKVAGAVARFISNGYSLQNLNKSDMKILSESRASDFLRDIVSGKVSLKNVDRLRIAERKRDIFNEAESVERNEDGTYSIVNADGERVAVQEENDLVEFLSNFSDSAQRIFLDGYQNADNISEYKQAFKDAYQMGYDVEHNNADYDRLVNVLGRDAITLMRMGREASKQNVVASAEHLESIVNDIEKEGFKAGKFTANVEVKRLNSKKRQLFNFAKGLSALGINVTVIDNKSDDSTNGQYDLSTNTVTINLSARLDSDFQREMRRTKGNKTGYVVQTVSHELTHWMEVNSKDAYNELKNLVKESLLSKFDGEVNAWDEAFKVRYDQAIDEGQTPEEATRTAESEVVARACENVLNNNEEFIEMLSQSSPSTLMKIRDAIIDFFNKFGEQLKRLVGETKSDVFEAELVGKVEEEFQEIKKAWMEAFKQGIARSQSRERIERAEVEMGIDASEDAETAAASLDSTKQTYSLQYERLGFKSYEQCIDEVAKDINEKANIGDIEKVKRWIKAEESISALIMKEENRRYLDYEPDDRYEAIKKNSDYKQGTFDLSNLCRKREIFTKMFDALQRENPDVMFDADDIATIRQVLVKEHKEVACALCYVEDRRQKMGEIADAFISFYNNALDSNDKHLYKFAKTNDPRYNKWGLDENGRFVEMKNGGYKRTGLYPTKDQIKKYGISSSQYKANDTYRPKQYDLVTYEGLKKLQQEHPTIAYAFERYNNSRGQQAARVIEGHAEYKREVLDYTKDMVKKANDLGGLRVFSFSDFEAIHLIDVCQIIVDCAKMGVKIQTYTKVPEFAALVRNTGIKLNRSLIPANVGSENAYARVIKNGKQQFVKVKPYKNGIAKLNGKDVLAFDNVEGIDVTSKYFLDESDSKNIGNILIGMSKEQIELAMLDPFIDYIIPFHTGQKKSVLHAKGIAEWKNYKDVQLDKKMEGSNSKLKEINIYSVISEYNVTNKYELFDAFIDKCNKEKFVPRFSDFISKDSKGNYQYTEGYWKMLLDFKMFDAEGNILPQENIRPDIDEKLAKKILLEGRNREEQIRFDDDLVGKVKDALAERHGVLNSAKRSNGIYENKAIEHFGVTDNFNVAGYILNDGQMLDFSGAHWLEGYDDAYIRDWKSKNDIRQVDHEDIYEVMEKSGDNRKQFMDRGNIRISPEAPGINISTKVEPTAEQYAKIKEFIETIKDGNRFYVDIEDTKPHKVNYNGKISADRVVNDIKSYFETGEMPKGSEGSLSEFLYSKKINPGTNNFITPNDFDDYFYKVGKKKKFNRVETYENDGRVFATNHQELMDFIRDSKANNKPDETITYMKVGDDIADRIMIELKKNGINDVDVHGYYWQLQQHDVYHSLRKHTDSAENGDLPLPIYKFAYFLEHINNCLVENVTPKNQTPDNTIRIELSLMYLDGVTIGVDVISKKEGTLNIKTAYRMSLNRYNEDHKNKGKWSISTVNTENESLSSTFDTKVSYSENNVNTLKSAKRTEEQRLTTENEKLKGDINNLRKLVRLQGVETHGYIPTKSTIEAAAKSILKSAESTYDRAELEKAIANAWSKLQKGNDITDDIRAIAENVVDDIKEQKEVDKVYRQMMNNLRKTHVSLTPKQLEYAKQKYGSPLKNFSDYRNAFMGKVILDKNAQSLNTMWERWAETYPEVFEQGISEEGMVDGLIEAYATIKEASEVVVDIDTENATNEVMQTITEKMWNIASYQTVADKYAAQIKEIKAKHRKDMNAIKKQRDEQKLADEMHYRGIIERTKRSDRNYYVRKLTEARQQRDEQKLADDIYYRRLLTQVRQQRDERINSIKEFTRQRKETDKQRAEKKRLITKINRISKKLMDKLLADSAKKSVPADLKAPVINLLRAIDFSSQQLLGMRGGENAFKPTKNDLSIAAAMAQMTEIVNKSMAAQADGGFIIDLPGDYADTVSKINTNVAKITDRIGNSVFVLQEMDTQTLNDIADMLEVMNTSVNLMNQMIASRNKHSVDGIAREIIKEAKAKGVRKNSSVVGFNAVDDFINKEQITPYYFFKHLGSGGVKVFEELQDGFDRYAFHIKSIVDFSKANWTGKQVKEWTKTVKGFDIQEARTNEQVENDEEGRTTHIEMTIPQIMSLYCLNKREQARKHIYKKGIKIAEFKNGAKMGGDNTVTLSEEDVARITGVLTEEQIRVADAIQNHMNTTCKNWMNEITMKRFGIIGALEENYFPIKSDSNALSVEANDTNAQGIYRLLNMSFTKQLNINANNEIVVGDIFTVFTDHATDMAKYNAVALPTLDLIKVLNYNESEKTEGSQIQTMRLRNELDSAYGKRAVQYINKMLTDLNGAVRSESGSQIIDMLNRNYKIAAVGANLQVALLQCTSAVRASYSLDPRYIARGFARRPQIRKVQEECGISAWKQLGFYQINVNRGLEHQIRQDDSWYDVATDASMKGAEFMDNLTWGYLYNACEEYARSETDFATDSKEFRQAVNDKFRQVVYSTQVVDSTLTRSDYMRNTNWLNKTTSAFMAEPTLTYNMVYDAFNGLVSDLRKGVSKGQALRNNGRHIARATMAFLVAAALESSLRAGISMLRKPEDGENYPERLLDYFLKELNPLSKMPIFKDILEIIEGYGSSNMAYGGLETTYQAFNKIKKSIVNREPPTYKEVYLVANALSQTSGLAVSGAMRDVVMLWNAMCRLMGWESLIIN